MKVHRRDFLKISGATGVGCILFNPVLGAFARSEMDKLASGSGARGSGTWIPTTCQGCTTWCPVEVYVENDRAIKVRGNQNSKINNGYCCPRGHLIPQIMYDPDRLKVPMKRTAATKGIDVDPKFVPISWNEALDEVADQIIALRANAESHKFAVLRGRYSGAADLIYSATPKIIGSPNGISHSAICAEAEKAGPYFTEALWGYRDYDLDNTKCLVLWGVDPTRSNRQVPRGIKDFGSVLDKAAVITIDPVLTTAASKSKYWLPVKPGYDGALASAIAHEIMTAGAWNTTFVGDFNDKVNLFKKGDTVDAAKFTENYTNGIVEWWNLELKDKDAAWAESLTGINAGTIKKVAIEMGQAAPNVAVWLGPGPVMTPRGTYTAMGIHALNGLLGSADNVGGSIRNTKQKSAGIPSYSSYQDAIAKTGAAFGKIDQRGSLPFPALKNGKSGGGVVTNNVANAMLAKDPYDLKAVIGYWCNFNFSGQGTKRWNDAMAALPFFAHITTHASEMTRFADIVLPAAFHATEKLTYVKTMGNTYSSTGIQQPVAKRLFDVYGDENEIMFKLSERLKAKGFSNLNDYFTTEFKDPDTSNSPTTAEEFALYATKLMTKPAYDSLVGGWDEFKLKGVVNFGPYTFKSKWADFGTETGKFEFYSETLKKALDKHATKHSTTVDDVLDQCNYVARGDLAFVPHYEEPKRWGDKATYPFDFIDVKSRLNREGRSANAAWTYEFKKCDPGDESGMEDYVKMNPSDAQGLGISDGDTIKLTTVEGNITTKAKLWEGIRPGVVAKTFGMGHNAYGKIASEDFANATARGNNNNEFMPDDYDRISGSSARNGGYLGVKIEKV